MLLTAVLVASAVRGSRPGSARYDKHLGGHPIPHTPAAAYLLVIAAGLALAWRRRYPVPVLVFATACVAAYSLAGWVNGVRAAAPGRRAVLRDQGMAGQAGGRRGRGDAARADGAPPRLNNPFGPVGGGFDLIPGAGRRGAVRRAGGQQPARLHRDGQGPGRRGGPPAGRLRTAAHRPGAARRGRAHDGHHQCAGRGGRARTGRSQPPAGGRGRDSAAIPTPPARRGCANCVRSFNVLRQADDIAREPVQPTPGLRPTRRTWWIARSRRAGLTTEVRVTGELPGRCPRRSNSRPPDHPGGADQRARTRRGHRPWSKCSSGPPTSSGSRYTTTVRPPDRRPGRGRPEVRARR